MIKVHRLNGQEIVINVDQIESVESVPDTVINTETGNRFVVKESMDEVQKLVVEFRRSCNTILPNKQ